ncbi:MAG: leucine--tRNA ligase [Rickettsiales bacterium]|jgi:leucyl-tRNA synthetase|nr:leucine--tRNA ligase [Rickettsiales bacterium]
MYIAIFQRYVDMIGYDFRATEEKWQKYWKATNSFRFNPNDPGKKFYMLSMFPYPSGELHVGHLRNFVIGDVLARFKRMQGYSVLHPMGADAFGLPAENAALRHQIHPEEWTRGNIGSFIDNMEKLGLSYDFSRFFSTCFPDYYGKQQQLFKELLKNDLVYRREGFVNWDPVDQTVLANEQVIDGRGWRSGARVERKKLNQWFFRVTNYAKELLEDIDKKLQNWPEKVKLMQRNWIGRSEGALIDFAILDGENEKIAVYSTRPETLFGASFIALSSDHPLAERLTRNNRKIADFVLECRRTAVNEETIETVEKIGIDSGLEVVHPLDPSWRLPVYIANFVLSDYGTGALFACPGHDRRDYEFARKYGLPIKKVVEGGDLPFEGDGIMINSDFLNGLDTTKARENIIDRIERLGLGSRKTSYRLRDWGFSRQRYWGCPIPVVYCDRCSMVPLEDSDLPLELPKDVEFTGRGNPLANHPSWKYAICPKCGGRALRETDTMDTFVDSSWYFLRYPELTDKEPFNAKLCEEMLPLDQYVGGIEHATMHLIYCRFFTKALRDCGYFKIDEPVNRLFNLGMVCHRAYRSKTTGDWIYPEDVQEKVGKYYSKTSGEELNCDGVIKMSKSKSNVIDTRKVINVYGTDAVRMFVMSDSPADKDFEWTQDGLRGCYRYISRLHGMLPVLDKKYDFNLDSKSEIARYTHRVIRDVTRNLENFEFNRAIAKIRELTNMLEKAKAKTATDEQLRFSALVIALKLLSPFTPHFCSEMLEIAGISDFSWPNYDEELVREEDVVMAVQINGKLRSTVSSRREATEEEVIALAKGNPNIQRYLEGKRIEKVIVVPCRVINLITQS